MGGYDRAPIVLPYNRERAVEYARRWALDRNPQYANFEKYGGDCTNFASQVLFAGSGVMNYTPIYGWYYINSSVRTASWTGVNFLFDFLTRKEGPGPYAERVNEKDLQPGDIIQLAFKEGSSFQHSLVVVGMGEPVKKETILIATHTDDQDQYLLTGYNWVNIRYLHILGVLAQ